MLHTGLLIFIVFSFRTTFEISASVSADHLWYQNPIGHIVQAISEISAISERSYTAYCVSGTLKSDALYPIYISIGQYLKTWFRGLMVYVAHISVLIVDHNDLFKFKQMNSMNIMQTSQSYKIMLYTKYLWQAYTNL